MAIFSGLFGLLIIPVYFNFNLYYAPVVNTFNCENKHSVFNSFVQGRYFSLQFKNQPGKQFALDPFRGKVAAEPSCSGSSPEQEGQVAEPGGLLFHQAGKHGQDHQEE